MTEAINGLNSEQRDTKGNLARGKSKSLRRKLMLQKVRGELK